MPSVRALFCFTALCIGCGLLCAQLVTQTATTSNSVTSTTTLDTGILATFTAPGTYGAGMKQTFVPSATTAGINLVAGPLPTGPVPGDLAIDATGDLQIYWKAWATPAIASTTLTAGAPVIGAGNYGVTVGTTTGTGPFCLSSDCTLINPVVTGFVNATHNHSNAANGGAIANTAFSGPVTFSSLPACSGATEGSRGAVSDSTTNTWGAVVAGGGKLHVLAYCDGTDWTVAAQ
jgi:hypothetical protein